MALTRPCATNCPCLITCCTVALRISMSGSPMTGASCRYRFACGCRSPSGRLRCNWRSTSKVAGATLPGRPAPGRGAEWQQQPSLDLLESGAIFAFGSAIRVDVSGQVIQLIEHYVQG